ncbi:MAG: metalloregulator ArsR/SmtB family transcription factor [Acidobacteria bacterium]|nr:metalloregulator ArsR/SmtB family transcription factor [Acidobacteriota bacterium]
MAVLGDLVRCRILLSCEQQELTVSELCTVLQLPQSTVSRHLKTLLDDGWVEAHKDGTSRLYSARQRSSETAIELWCLVRRELRASPRAREDQRRLLGVLAERPGRSKAFFSSAAGQWAEMRQELFGNRFDLEAMLALLNLRWTVADLGCGAGDLTAALAPHVHRVIAVDESPEMLRAAAERLARFDNVDVRSGRLEQIPISDGELDAATMILVLHHVASPEAVLNEAARCLRPGGKLLLVDMLPHDRERFRSEMGHVWLGFDRQRIEQWLASAQLESVRFTTLTPQPDAHGPSLFAASAIKPPQTDPDSKPTTASPSGRN